MNSGEVLLGLIDVPPEGQGRLLRLLRQEGYRVALRETARDALGYACARKPSLALLIGRQAAARELALIGQLYAASPSTRILLLSHRVDVGMDLQVLDHGGDEILPLPIRSADLLGAMKRMVKLPDSPSMRPEGRSARRTDGTRPRVQGPGDSGRPSDAT